MAYMRDQWSGLSTMSTSLPAAIAEEAHGHLVTGEFALDDFIEVHVFAIDVDHARAVHGLAVE